LALEKGILLAPLTTVKDVVESPQFAARGFWQEAKHPELGATITYPGYPIKMNQAPYRVQRRAPLIGEHNDEVYEKELGFSKEQLGILKNGGVI
jgi:crotonobetainyl-CoA:carnitine CoA-transferase CaiB-like acyl-CoA transferase